MQLSVRHVLLSPDRRTCPVKDGVKAFTVMGRRVIIVMVLLLVIILIFMKSFSLVFERDIPTGIA